MLNRVYHVLQLCAWPVGVKTQQVVLDFLNQHVDVLICCPATSCKMQCLQLDACLFNNVRLREQRNLIHDDPILQGQLRSVAGNQGEAAAASEAGSRRR